MVLDWVTLTSGLGRLKMNQSKIFFAVTKSICFDALYKDVLNFASPKAFDFLYHIKTLINLERVLKYLVEFLSVWESLLHFSEF